MIIEWEKISSEIQTSVKSILKNGIPSYTDAQISLAVNRIKNIIHFNVSIGEYNNMPRRLMPSLQRALITHKIPVDDLVTIATQIESFMKKVCLILNKLTSSQLITKSYRFEDLYKILILNASISAKTNHSQHPILNKNHIDSYRNQPEYLYELCLSKIIRNTVHNSQELTILEFAEYLTSLLVSIVYISLKYGSELDLVVTEFIPSNFQKDTHDIDKNEYLGYAYFTYGDDLSDVKESYINSLIQYSLFSKEMTIEELRQEAISTHKLDLNTFLITSSIGKMRAQGQIILNNASKSFSLSSKMAQSVQKKLLDFRYNKNFIETSIKEVLSIHSLDTNLQEVIKLLNAFYLDSYGIAVNEIVNDFSSDRKLGVGAVDYELINFFKEKGLDTNTTLNLIRELYDLTSENEFIARTTAGSVFSGLTQIEEVQNFASKTQKNLFLDTQILLQAIFIDYNNSVSDYNNFYSIVKDLVYRSRKDENINLFAPGPYVSEVGFQTKMALMLIPFAEGYPEFESNNIFYTYYLHLKNKNELNGKSFSEFIFDLLRLRNKDLNKQNSRQFIEQSISKEFEKIGIPYLFIDKYQNYEEMIEFIHTTSYKYSLRSKSNAIAKSDGWIINFLSDESQHSNTPIFITWDSAFDFYRNDYKEDYARDKNLVWHQFTPGKFLTLLDLSSLRFSGLSINNEIIGMIDQNLLTEKVKSIFDVYAKFIDTSNLTEISKREYFNVLTKLFSDKFGSNLNNEYERKKKVNSAFDSAVDKINSTLHHEKSAKLTIANYNNFFENSDKFELLVNTILSKINETSLQLSNEELIPDIEKLIDEEA